MTSEIHKRLEVLKEQIMEEIGEKKYCPKCNAVHWDLEDYFCDPMNPQNYSKESKDGFLLALLATCQKCGSLAIKEVFKIGPDSFHYID